MNDTRHDFERPEGPRGSEELLTAYLFDELEAAERAKLEERLAVEPSLQAQWERLRGTLSLLRQAALDGGPSQLSGDRREALRAEALIAHGGAGAPLAPDSEAKDFAPILHFPWLRTAAAGLIVTAGVVLYQQSGMQEPEVGFEADAPTSAESRLMESLGYRDGSARNQAEDAESKGIAGRTGIPDASNESTFERGGGSRSAFSELQDRARAKDNSLSSEDLLAGLSGQAESPEAQQLSGNAADTSRGFVGDAALGDVSGEGVIEELESEVGALALLGGAGGGTFRGPGDTVPPDGSVVPETVSVLGVTPSTPPSAGATATPPTPPTPATPATPSTPSTPALEFAPPAPGQAAPAVSPEPSAQPKRQSETSVETRSFKNRELERRELKEGLFFDEAGITGGEQQNLSLDLDVLTFGVADQLYGEEFGRDELLGREVGRFAYLHDGYGRRHHQDQIIAHLRPIHEDESPRDMFFRYYGDNAFVPAAQDTMSTFAVDVDTASYPLARNYLNNGQLPPRASVRTEEVVNYFDQGLVAPEHDVFSVQLDSAPTPFGSNSDNLLLRVGVKAIEVSREERLPMNVVFVVDKSGSMREQNRLGLVQRSLELLLDQMRDDDKIGIVSFDTNGHVVQESIHGRDRWQAREALRTLSPGGSTNAAEGLFLGYEMLDRHYIDGGINRLVLASDGVANTGQTDQERILEEVADFTARQVDLTTVGVGMGNHNDVFLEQLADKGNGSCHYVDGFDEAKRVFLDEFAGTMQTVARDVKIQVEFDPQRVMKWRQLGYENRSLTHAQFRDDTVDAGEVGAGHEIVALYELELAPEADLSLSASESDLAKVRMRWQTDPAFAQSLASVQKSGILAPAESDRFEAPAEPIVVEREWSLLANQVQSDWAETDSRFRLAAVAAQYAEFLRRSYHVRGDSYDRLEADAAILVAELPQDEQVRELRELIRRTRDLVRYREPGSELWKLIEESRRITMLQQELRGKKDRGEESEELLVELLEQNKKLEERIREHLDGSGD